MILYDKEKEETTELEDFEVLLENELKDKESKSDDKLVSVTDNKALEEALYNAMKRAMFDYEEEKKRAQEEEEELLKSMRSGEPSPSPSPTPEPQIVHVENFPHVQDVNVIDWHTVTDAIPSVGNYDNEAVDFSTSTDSRLYTVGTSAHVSSATGQSAVYLLEIRNIIIIFCLFWFVVYMVSMLKRVAKKYGKGE